MSTGGVIRLNCITVRMSCPEYLRLCQHYDAALRRWAQIDLSSHRPEVFDASARLAEVIRSLLPGTARSSTQFSEI
jgi:hypothetical protein